VNIVNIVQPHTPTTLLLDNSYMPFGVATAKGAFYGMLKGRGVGLDAFGIPFDWDKLLMRDLSILPDQPCMRSAPKGGNETIWPIPTVFIANHRFFYRPRKKNEDTLPSVREVYDFYHGMCCFCGEHIRHIKDASREHVHSKSLGGSHGIKNIVLAHKLCNSLAGHTMPKLDKDGNEIVPKMKVYPSHFIMPSNIRIRDEWKRFLFLE
jgi:5-methylcytosine-specific restriction endonuclease McrA